MLSYTVPLTYSQDSSFSENGNIGKSLPNTNLLFTPFSSSQHPLVSCLLLGLISEAAPYSFYLCKMSLSLQRDR